MTDGRDVHDVHDVLDQVPELWSPQVVDEDDDDDDDLEAADVGGDHPEHVHDGTDGSFLGLAGRLHRHLPDRTATLDLAPTSSAAWGSATPRERTRARALGAAAPACPEAAVDARCRSDGSTDPEDLLDQAIAVVGG